MHTLLTKKKIEKILTEKVLKNEITPREIYHFSLLKNIDKATKRVVDAIKKGEKIVVVGDYDVDGVVASTIMHQFFKKINYPIEVILPHRVKDGYGLTSKLMERIECNVLISVDNGISSYEPALICKERGIDFIITDHHTPKYPLPDAYTILNPKQKDETFPFKEICGAEVAWYFCASINSALNSKIDMREFLDYLVLAIIGDVMPLIDLNRVLVKMGLARLSYSSKPFAIVLRENLGKDYFKSEDVSFQIVPKLNSAGRMRDANLAFKFLNSESVEEAQNIYNELNFTNEWRKKVEKEITQICINNNQKKSFIVESGPFHEGVIGIVASRLVEHYKLPAIVFSEKDGILKGSGRSLGEVNIYELVNECREFLESFGGHKLACGLSIKKENLEKFKRKIEFLTSQLPQEHFFLDEFILGELPLSECDLELVDILNRFEPYGEGNPRPKFYSKVKIVSVKRLKDNHYKFLLSSQNFFREAVIFNYNGNFEFNDEVKIIFTIDEDYWNGYRYLKIVVDRIEKIDSDKKEKAS